MMATTAMAETAMAMAMAKATAMMLPPPPILMMSMTTRAAIRGWQLDDGNWTTTMGQQRYASMMTAMTAIAEMAKGMAMAMAMATATETATPMMLPPLTAKMLMKTTVAIQGWRLDVNDGTTLM
jgi:hypothetical protein